MGAEGRADSWVTIRAAQDGQTGQVIVDGGINYNSKAYVTIDGLFGGVAQFVVPKGWVTMPQTTDPKLIGVILQAGSVDCTYASKGEWAFNEITMAVGGSDDYAVRFNAVNQGLRLTGCPVSTITCGDDPGEGEQWEQAGWVAATAGFRRLQ